MMWLKGLISEEAVNFQVSVRASIYIYKKIGKLSDGTEQTHGREFAAQSSGGSWKTKKKTVSFPEREGSERGSGSVEESGR